MTFNANHMYVNCMIFYNMYYFNVMIECE